ncbi:MAG: isoamylase early set domain-containing protein [Acidimicrobiia bacterium]
MISKTPAKKGATTKVTFEVPTGTQAESVHLCGDFNEWSKDANPLVRRKDGRWSVTMTLPQGNSYRFRYLVDGQHWVNDDGADEYVDNEYGSDDSLVRV